MGRNLSPVLSQELANLEKDADSRKLAMKALKSYVKGLDSKAIPMFLAQVSESKNAGFSSGEYTISLYEVLARVHGPNIVSQIDNIMATIIKTLTTSGGSFPLQQACSKVVPAIARYAIEPTTPEDKKKDIIHSLCRPLSETLLGTQESLSCGSALCLKALVDADNWRFASDEMVNQVCLRLAGALEDKLIQTNSHMGLVMSLAKRNSIIIEPYARLLIQFALRILDSGAAESNSQKRLTAIHMIDFLMKCLDIRCICSELGSIIDEMDKCLSDPMRYVSGAAYEALQTARRLAEKSPKCDRDVISVTGSNFSGRNSCQRRILSNGGDKSPVSTSPESQILDSFAEYGSLTESPLSESHVSCNFSETKNVNRKLWRSHESGGVDISLQDGLFPEIVHGGAISHAFPAHDGDSDTRESRSNGFTGFNPGVPLKESLRSRSPSPQVNLDSVKIFTTPRKLFRSLQETEMISDSYENQARRFRTSCSCKCHCNAIVNHHNQNGLSYEMSCDGTENGNVAGDEQCHSNSESVSSTEDIPVGADGQVSSQVVPKSNHQPRDLMVKTFMQKTTEFIPEAIFLVLIAVLVMLQWSGFHDEGPRFVPT